MKSKPLPKETLRPKDCSRPKVWRMPTAGRSSRGGKYRLGDGIAPVNYAIEFRPNLTNSTFSGRAAITMEVKERARRITLNSYKLAIKRFAVRQGSGIKVSMKADKKRQTLTFVLGRELEKGKARIELEFEGALNDDLCGFYRSKYKTGGKEKYMAVTQFEAPYARMAFPCFDQPDKKATFDVTLVLDRNLQGISNMPVKRESMQGGKKILEFGRTPVMSTYLLFVAAGEFEFLEGEQDGKTIRVATIPGKKEEGKRALELAMKFLKYFEDYTGIPYPLPKLDMIAIPDFAAGAMENWGAITFRELLVLSDENTSVIRKRRLAEVIAHELWHQWSGNLVTMKWWNDLWLNESFADYMAYKAVDHYFPGWKIMDEFLLSETEPAFSLDSLGTTHPIEVRVNSPNEVNEIFDAISYNKGGNVLRMIEAFMGEDAFRKGVSRYLSNFKYGNAESRDFWDALSEFSGSDIRKTVESWIRQPGYPLVEARRMNSSLQLKQERFSDKKHKQLWRIPLVIRTEKGETRNLFCGSSMRLPLEQGWFKLNAGQQGFYRVKYAESELETLGREIQGKRLGPMDRWGVQSDLFSLCWMGKAGISQYLDFLKHYRNEDSYVVLLDIYGNMRYIYNTFFGEPGFEKVWPRFTELMKEPFERALRRLSWEPKEGEPHEDTMLRALAISYLGFARDGGVLGKCMDMFKCLSERGAAIQPDIKGPVYAVVAENFPATFKAMMAMHGKATNLEDRQKLLTSLYRFRDKKNLSIALDYALSPKVRAQDLRNVFGMVAANPSFRRVFPPWVKKNWKKLEGYKENYHVFSDLLEAMIKHCAADGKEKQVRKFLAAKKVEFERTKANSFEFLRINGNFAKRNRRELKNFFM